ncbi:hypothetical protein [Halorubellus litoreus]|uniref:Uncharacterized protein n=1 Tax=Halorubellus litoreus TaxID=755308 RepID=A0ABD5VH68_9EURY
MQADTRPQTDRDARLAMTNGTDRQLDVQTAVAELEARLDKDTDGVPFTLIEQRDAVAELRELARTTGFTVQEPTPLAGERVRSLVDALVGTFENVHGKGPDSRATALFDLGHHAKQLEEMVVASLAEMFRSRDGVTLSTLAEIPDDLTGSVVGVGRVVAPPTAATVRGSARSDRRLNALVDVASSAVSAPVSPVAARCGLSLLGMLSVVDPCQVGNHEGASVLVPDLLRAYRATDEASDRVAALRAVRCIVEYHESNIQEPDTLVSVVESACQAEDCLVRASGLAVADAVADRTSFPGDATPAVAASGVEAFVDSVVTGLESNEFPVQAAVAFADVLETGVVTAVTEPMCQRIVDVVAADEKWTDADDFIIKKRESRATARRMAVECIRLVVEADAVPPSATLDCAGLVAALSNRNQGHETYATALARLVEGGYADPSPELRTDAVAAITQNAQHRFVSTAALGHLVDAGIASRADVERLRDRLIAETAADPGHGAADVLDELAADFPQLPVTDAIPVDELVDDVQALRGSESARAARALTVLVEEGILTEPLDVPLETIRRARRSAELETTEAALQSLLFTLADAGAEREFLPAVRREYGHLVGKDPDLSPADGLAAIERLAADVDRAEGRVALARAAAAVVPVAAPAARKHAARIAIECVGPSLDGVDGARVVDPLAAVIPELPAHSRHESYELLVTLLRADSGRADAVPVYPLVDDVHEGGGPRNYAAVELLAVVVDAACVECPISLLESTLLYALNNVLGGREHAVDALVALAEREWLSPARVAVGLVAAAVRVDERRPDTLDVSSHAFRGIRDLIDARLLWTVPAAARAALVDIFRDDVHQPTASLLTALVDGNALAPADLADQLAVSDHDRSGGSRPSWLESPTSDALEFLELASERKPGAFERYAPALRDLLRTEALDGNDRLLVVQTITHITRTATAADR